MLERTCAFPCDASVPSRRRMICGCCKAGPSVRARPPSIRRPSTSTSTVVHRTAPHPSSRVHRTQVRPPPSSASPTSHVRPWRSLSFPLARTSVLRRLSVRAPATSFHASPSTAHHHGRHAVRRHGHVRHVQMATCVGRWDAPKPTTRSTSIEPIEREGSRVRNRVKSLSKGKKKSWETERTDPGKEIRRREFLLGEGGKKTLEGERDDGSSSGRMEGCEAVSVRRTCAASRASPTCRNAYMALEKTSLSTPAIPPPPRNPQEMVEKPCKQCNR